MCWPGDGEREGLYGQRGRGQQEEGQVQRCHVLPHRDGTRPQGSRQSSLDIL